MEKPWATIKVSPGAICGSISVSKTALWVMSGVKSAMKLAALAASAGVNVSKPSVFAWASALPPGRAPTITA
jgi:hypothetical protein